MSDKSDEELSPYLPELFRWLKDLNWPGAICIYDRLIISEDELFEYELKVSITTAKAQNDKLWLQALKNLKKDQLLILLLAGILLMVIAVPAGKTKEHASSASDGNTGKTVRGTSDGTDEEAYTTYLEDRLSRILSQIEGTGEVKVMITLKSSAEKVLDKDTESDQETVMEEDSQGGTRQSSKASKKENTVYASDSDSTTQGSGSPYVSKELSPEIEGVVVIADGGGNAVVKENISSAVQALFDIEPHKIRIMKKQTN